MKTKITVLIGTLILFVLASTGFLFGHGFGQHGMRGSQGYGMGSGPSGMRGAKGLLGNEMYKARIEVLAEITGQDIDAVRKQLGTKSFYSIIEENDIDRTAFHALMTEKVKSLLQKAKNDGTITEEQADTMMNRMEARGDGDFPCDGKGSGRMRGQGRGPHGPMW